MGDNSGLLEIPVACAPVYKSRGGNKILLYIDVAFGKEVGSVDLSYITFDNNYVASIAIMMQLTTSGGFFAALDSKILMPQPDCEGGAQCTCKIKADELSIRSTETPGSGVSPLRCLRTIRIYLYQPSPQWEIFELRNIRAWCIRPLPPTVSLANSSSVNTPTFSTTSSSTSHSTITAMATSDLEFLIDLKRRQSEKASFVAPVRSDNELQRYRRDLSKKKDKKRRK
jgi:hypothetical protein